MSLTDIQRECFSNFLDDFPLVIRSLADQPFRADVVCQRAMELAEMMETGDIPPEEEMCNLTRAIYKASIEKNDWLKPYAGQSAEANARMPKMLRTMRECAAVLEGYGIEVDFVPI